jgi:hypothetical protein
MDGQHCLWSDAEACRDDFPDTHCVDILDILHVASHVQKAAKALCSSTAEQKEFARERLFRILSREVAGVIMGLTQMSTRPQLSSEKAIDIDTVRGYFTAPQDRMKYNEYLAAGYHIVTGVNGTAVYVA